MTVAFTDRSWFAAHPGRAYRVRPIRHEDADFWMRPQRPGLFLWCVVRRDGAICYFTLPVYASLDDADDELAPVFAELQAKKLSGPTTFAPTPGGNLARIEGSLSTLLMASSPFEPDAPPAEAYREEMRTRGCEALALGGRETLTYLADRITAAMPERAAVHAAILQVAWAGLVELQKSPPPPWLGSRWRSRRATAASRSGASAGSLATSGCGSRPSPPASGAGAARCVTLLRTGGACRRAGRRQDGGMPNGTRPAPRNSWPWRQAMTNDLGIFAKVRALRDSTTSPGEKTAAAARMTALARGAGLTVEEAERRLDRPAPKSAGQAMAESFAEFMGRPEFVAERVERERQRVERVAAAVAEYGSETAVFADSPIEAALRVACEPLLGPGQTWDGVYELAGWGWLLGRDRMPEALRTAVAGAWPMPETVAAAWAEHQARDQREGDRYALFPDWTPHAFTEARRGLVDEILNTCPARSLLDLRARLSWLDELNEIDAATKREQRVRLATLRADVERMAMRLRAQERCAD